MSKLLMSSIQSGFDFAAAYSLKQECVFRFFAAMVSYRHLYQLHTACTSVFKMPLCVVLRILTQASLLPPEDMQPFLLPMLHPLLRVTEAVTVSHHVYLNF